MAFIPLLICAASSTDQQRDRYHAHIYKPVPPIMMLHSWHLGHWIAEMVVNTTVRAWRRYVKYLGCRTKCLMDFSCINPLSSLHVFSSVFQKLWNKETSCNIATIVAITYIEDEYWTASDHAANMDYMWHQTWATPHTWLRLNIGAGKISMNFVSKYNQACLDHPPFEEGIGIHRW